MAKFCGKCGSKLDRKDGLCQKCDAIEIEREKSRFIVSGFLLAVAACILIAPFAFRAKERTAAGDGVSAVSVSEKNSEIRSNTGDMMSSEAARSGDEQSTVATGTAAATVVLSPEIAKLSREMAQALITVLEAPARILQEYDGLECYCYFADFDGDGASELLVNEFDGLNFTYSLYDYGNGTLEAKIKSKNIATAFAGSCGYAETALFRGNPVVVTFSESGETGSGARTESIYTMYDGNTHKRLKQFKYRQIWDETQKIYYIEDRKASELEYMIALSEFEEINDRGRKMSLLELMRQLQFAVGIEPDEQIDQSNGENDVTFTRRFIKNEGSASYLEYATITKYGTDGSTLWEYTTDMYPAEENFRISEPENYAREDDGRYYFSENGTLIALDRHTGEVVWTNEGFGGMAVAYFTESDGTAYFCGYTGPHFFAVDRSGNTLKRIESFGEGYTQAYMIFKDEKNIIVCLDWGPDKQFKEEFYDLQYSGDDYFEEFSNYIADFYFIVDPTDYSYHIMEY